MGVLFCVSGCLPVSLTSTHSMPVALSHLWHPKISPDIVECSLGVILTLVVNHWIWQSLVNAKTSEWKSIRNRIFYTVFASFYKLLINCKEKNRNITVEKLGSHHLNKWSKSFFNVIVMFIEFQTFVNVSLRGRNMYYFNCSFTIKDSEINS